MTEEMYGRLNLALWNEHPRVYGAGMRISLTSVNLDDVGILEASNPGLLPQQSMMSSHAGTRRANTDKPQAAVYRFHLDVGSETEPNSWIQKGRSFQRKLGPECLPQN